MQRVSLTKPDGRTLFLYARDKLAVPSSVPSPFQEPLAGKPHLRWHPLRGEWVTYAAHRQDRTFLPPPEFNPLAVTTDASRPTELPPGDWTIAVFENRFPSLDLEANGAPDETVATAPARGRCEVVVFTQDSRSSLSRLPLAHLALLLDVWADRTSELGARSEIHYVLPFENRGAEVGVTLHHPHGQIYAYPVVPPVPARINAEERAHLARTGRGLLEELIEREISDGRRMLFEDEHAVAFVPPCARYPYEVWVAPRRTVADFCGLAPAERNSVAAALKTVLLKYDALWQRPLPYLMAWYQAPTDGQPHPESHLHAEIWPPYRSRDRLKYLAGTELAAGFYAMDALPEDTARELQAIEVSW